MRAFGRILGAGVAALLLGAVPAAARSPLLVSDRQLEAMSEREFEEVKARERLVEWGGAYDAVQRVGSRVARATDRHDFDWEFILVDSPVANAWALPGGKVAVYTGLLPIVEDEAGLAAVLSHEVAHAVAEHAAERVSQGTIQGILGLLLSEALDNSSKRDEWMTAYGLGSNVAYILPYSRRSEGEADAMGLEIMARAGYDPRAAVDVWDRMRRRDVGRGPTWLSTHPDPEDRADRLRSLLPDAMDVYDRNPVHYPATPIPYDWRWDPDRRLDRYDDYDRYDGRGRYDDRYDGEGDGFRIQIRF